MLTEWRAYRTQYAHGVVYHSAEWASMVETGWITMVVDANGFATMIKQPGKR